MKEKYIIEAEERAEFEAKYFIENMRDIADKLDIEEEWFIETVIAKLNKYKKKEVTNDK